MQLTAPPLSLYVHMPWCVKKCPYCDFNSHGLSHNGHATPPYEAYIDALLADLDADIIDAGPILQGRKIISVFFGGGTPSLFAAEHIARFLARTQARLAFSEDIEITLETNPGTVEHGCFKAYRTAGINRLSFGIQSFADDKLRRLGRIHTAHEAMAAVRAAQDAGYTNINLDLMYALPEQRLEEALTDMEQALALAPAHISHYQLTLEPHTAFAAQPPALPDEDLAWTMQEACQALLAQAGYTQYEVSAYAQPARRCVHNLNYWRFGDYLGIGAGAHGKLSDPRQGRIQRRWKVRHPRDYLATAGSAACLGGASWISPDELPFEYMLNALRLLDGVPLSEFHARTGLTTEPIAQTLQKACQRGWLYPDAHQLRATALGQRFLNDVIASFLSETGNRN